jgi:hypothetical protein
MVRLKARTTGRKRPASRKSAAKPKRAKRGIGDNKPPPDDIPAPPQQPNMGWFADDQTHFNVARRTAASQRQRLATVSNVPVGPYGQDLTNEPSFLHGQMRKRIAALERTIKELTGTPIEPKPDPTEIEEIKRELARLKALPPEPSSRLPDAVEAESTLRRIGNRVLENLATEFAKSAFKALWEKYGQDLINLANSIAEWIARLSP